MAGLSINLSAFAFHATVSRVLGPAGYGQLGPLLNLLQVLSLPLAAIQATVTRQMSGAGRREGTRGDLRGVTVSALALSGIADLVILAAAPTIDAYLHFSSAVPLLLVLPWIQASVVASIWQGALLADRRYGIVALALFIGGGPVRLSLGLLLSHAGGGPGGPILATTLGAVATPLLLLPTVVPHMRGRASASFDSRTLGYVVFSLGGVVVLGNIDAWVARHFLSGHGAGVFVAAVTLGRVPLFLPQALCTVMFPMFVSARSGAESRRLLRSALGGTAGLALLAEVGLVAFSPAVTSLVFGPAYSQAARLVGIIGLANCFIAVTTTLTYHQLARSSWQAVVPWFGCVGMGPLVLMFHGSPAAIALDACVSAATVLVASALLTFCHRDDDGERRRHPAALEPVPARRIEEMTQR